MKKFIAVLLAAVLGVSCLASCGSSKGNKLAEIKKAGKLQIYTNAEFPPYEFLGENGEIVGVDIEIAKAIAAEIGVELEINNTAFDGIVTSLSSGKGDLGVSGITIDDERKEQVDFSVPYVDSIQYLIVPEDSTIESMEDLEGMTLGGQTGTTGYMLVETEISKGELKDKDVEIKPFNSAPIAMQDLITGRLDAVVIDELVAKQIAQENEGYKAIPFVYADGEPVTEQFGVAVPKGNEDLLEIVDKVVQELLDSGKIDEWIDQYSEGIEE